MLEVKSDTDAAYEHINQGNPLIRTTGQRGLVQLKDGVVIAAVLYDEFNGNNIFLHITGSPGRRWLTRWFLHEAFKYPFITLGCGRITLWVNADNIDSLKFAEHLGFRREAVLEKAGPARQDVFLYVMFREACRYA